MGRNKNAVTLLELILAITFLSVIVLGVNSINQFAHFHTINADRRAKLQNELRIALEHMRREISKAIGNEVVDGPDSVINTAPISAVYPAIRVYVDSGTAYTGGPTPIYRTGDGHIGSLNDRWIVYAFTGATGFPAAPGSQYQIRFCRSCLNSPICTSCATPWTNINTFVAKNIAGFVVTKPVNAVGQLNSNSITVQISACWDPAIPESGDNPCITMDALITMPSVTAH